MSVLSGYTDGWMMQLLTGLAAQQYCSGIHLPLLYPTVLSSQLYSRREHGQFALFL